MIEIQLDTDEYAVISQLRMLCKHGFGKMEVVVVQHKVEAIYPTPSIKRPDFAKELLTNSK